MDYKKTKEIRDKIHKRIEDLKTARDLRDDNIILNDLIKKEKFKYKFYNQLLKENNENKSR